MFGRAAVASLLLGACIFSCGSLPAGEKAESEYKLVGPYSFKNIEIYLLAGKQGIGKTYLPLNQAMEKRIVEVYETGNVNSLSIENKSSEFWVFVNAGDIVKGGKQDRVLSFDLILAPKSGKLPIKSFCVESNRWRRRGAEKMNKFSRNECILPSKNLRLSSKYRGKQGEVWENVAKEQKKLERNVKKISAKDNVDVISPKSSSSLQLTLESKDLKKIIGEYVTALEKIPDGQENILGFAYAINGKVNNAEVYNNCRLFRDLWPKLLKAAAIEAIAEYDDSKKYEKVNAQDFVNMFLKAKQGTPENVRKLNKDTKMLDWETDELLLFETLDMNEDGKWIHRNYIKKGKEFRKKAPSSSANAAPQRRNCPVRQIQRSSY